MAVSVRKLTHSPGVLFRTRDMAGVLRLPFLAGVAMVREAGRGGEEEGDEEAAAVRAAVDGAPTSSAVVPAGARAGVGAGPPEEG